MSFRITGKNFHRISGRTFRMNAAMEINADTYCRTLSEAVRASWNSVKACARDLGVNTATAKNIFEAKNGANGVTLIKAMRESDEVLYRVLELAGRKDIVEKARAVANIDQALAALNRLKESA